METKLNILHYSIYLIHYKVHLLFNKINPFNLVHKLPFQKKKYDELGINIQDEIDKAFKNTEFGLSVLISGGIVVSLIFLTIISLSLLLLKIFGLNFTFNWYHLMIFGFLSYSICYFTIFKNEKYLVYFEEFQVWSDIRKKKIIRIGFISVFLILLFFFVILLLPGK